jgi:hypothetical protein
LREIKRFNIDTKLAPIFLTTMLTVINVLDQKRDEETDEFLGNDEAEEEEPKKEKTNVIYKNQRTKTLEPRKLNAKTDEILPKSIAKKKSVFNFHSSDSDDTMRSNIPQTLEIDQSTIFKLKQRILVWAEQQPGYDVKDVPVRLLLKNLDQIYSGNYQALKNVSVEEARLVNLPHWINTRIKDNMRTISIQQDSKINIKENPTKDSPY